MKHPFTALARTAAALALLAAGSASAGIVTFESLAAGAAADQFMADYVEDGYRFSFELNANEPDNPDPQFSPTGFGSWGLTSPGRAPGGSQALFNAGIQRDDNFREPGFTILRRDDGAAFDLLAIDLSHLVDYSNDGTPAAGITFTGRRADNSVVTASVSVTSFGFSSFSLGALTNVTQVRWQQTLFAHQFDNLNLALAGPVSGGDAPEPGSLALAGLALAALLGARRGRA